MSISSKHTAPICLFPQLTLYLPVHIVAYRDGQRDSSYPVLIGQKIKNYIYTEKIATLYLRTSRQVFCPPPPDVEIYSMLIPNQFNFLPHSQYPLFNFSPL
jgi:hypothetical protein